MSDIRRKSADNGQWFQSKIYVFLPSRQCKQI